MNVVLVDDDHLVCASLKVILETDPQVHIVASGSNGAEAVALYEEYRPDLQLMDIRMDGQIGRAHL